VFRGDFSPCATDEGWAFGAEKLITDAILPGVRIALQVRLRCTGSSFAPALRCMPGGAWRAQAKWVIPCAPLIRASADPLAVEMCDWLAAQLHQDHFADPDEYNHLDDLYDSITDYHGDGPLRTVVCSEMDRRWTSAVMHSSPALVSLRLNLEESSYNEEFFVPKLTADRRRSFRVFKLNREAVRGMWASQQQELLFFR